ncbi:molecular chaperone GrpE [Lachnospiraceae bacterium PH1-22]
MKIERITTVRKVASKLSEEKKSQEDMVKEAVEEAKENEQVMSEDEEKELKEEASEVKKEKKTSKRAKKDKKDEKIEELTDRLTRQMAEFDNFRKRTDKEKSQMYEIGAKDVVEKILPVIDNFERGLEAVPTEDKDNSFMQGMEMIYKQLLTSLEELGVKPIEAVGNPFNPDFHNAVMHVDDENFGENEVTEEFQKGYMYRDSVVRHSMVKVAN